MKRFRFVPILLLLLVMGLASHGEVLAGALTHPDAPTNTPPVAEFTVDPTSGGVVGTWFYFDPSGTHDNEDTLSWLGIRFDWEDDGRYDTGWLNPTDRQPRQQYESPGTYTVRMQVIDMGDLTDTVTHDIVVGDPGSNTAPTARCVVTPSSGTVNTVFTFSAATSTDAQDSISALHARWGWFSDGKFSTDWLPANQTQTHQFTHHGLQEVDLEIRDTGMLSERIVCTVDVQPEQPNTPPTASFTISPAQGTPLTNFAFDASSSTDAEDDNSWLEVRFDWNNDGILVRV